MLDSRLKHILRKCHLYQPLKRGAYALNGKSADLARWNKLLRFFEQFIVPDCLCFDIGAHLGELTEVFLTLGARVVSVEPNPDLVLAVQGRHGCRNLSVVQAAVDASCSHSELHVCNSDLASTLSKEFMDRLNASEDQYCQGLRWDKVIKVNTVTLDSLISSYGVPQFLKVDVEGGEPQVFEGLSQAVPSLSFEFTREHFAPAGEVMKTLGRLGTYSYNFSFAEEYELRLDEWLPADQALSQVESRLSANARRGDFYARLLHNH